jgi:hypothetical protein
MYQGNNPLFVISTDDPESQFDGFTFIYVDQGLVLGHIPLVVLVCLSVSAMEYHISYNVAR